MSLPQALPRGWWVIYEFDEWFEESLSDYHYSTQDDLEVFHLFENQTTQSALREFRDVIDYMNELRNDMDFIQENRRYKRRD